MISLTLLAGLTPCYGETRNRVDLRENWYLQSACKVNVPAEVLSTLRFTSDHWYKATVPSTVLAAQVADGEFKDIYYGDNLRKLPGMGDSGGQAGENPYACPWWYRTEFQVPPDFRGRRVWLRFNGINSKANVWLNGKKLADTSDAAGAYRIFEMEATPLLDPEQKNVLAVEVFAPTDRDFGINFVDWMPTPPDKDMGLWREVSLLASGPVRVRYPEVITHFPGVSLRRADLTVRTELYNDTNLPVAGVLQGEFETVSFAKKVTLAPREARAETFTPGEFPQLKIVDPELWWPAGLGDQKLHLLSMKFEAAGAVSDAQSASFGMREITGELYGASPRMGEVYDNNGDFTRVKTDTRPFLIRVNRQPVLIRGAGWAPEMLLRTTEERLRAELTYVRDMHLNAIRLEGKLEGDEFFDLADQMGILILAGWCCCDQWEHWNSWQPNDYTIATDSLRTQILRLRHHASLALWMNGSDNAPPAHVEAAYLKILSETGWPNPIVSSASSKTTTVSGASGVKMTGPYDYVPPGYWLIDKDHFGGAFGFNTETSPGAAIPVLGSIKKFLPQDHLWPIDAMWNMHTGAGNLNGNLKHFNESMNAIYGPPKGLDDYLRKSQAMAYDGERAMFEAYGRNKYQSTGVIQWMLNNGWPSMMWHLFDYYLQPAAGYFGAKKACEPLHIQFSYDDNGAVAVNSTNRDFRELNAEISVYDFNLRRLFFRNTPLDSPADSVRRLLNIPSENIDTDVHFVHLTITDKRGRVLSTNFYWLPEKLSTYDWSTESEKKHPYYTGVASYEDLTMLNQLRKVHMDVSASARRQPKSEEVSVRVHNPSDNLAFQIHLSIVDEKSGEEILPVLWEDNYFSLLPGESRDIAAHYDTPLNAGSLKLEVNGWNINAEAALVDEMKTDTGGTDPVAAYRGSVRQ
ncbi:MAG: sugar-binding domain-containing protein [Terriglobia bacterium]